jgi:Tfp pilus assembly protein PilN
MGLFWDLVQQSQISEQSERAGSLENRVEQLENELHKTRELLHKLVTVLEKEYDKDIDGDGRIG